jgi:endonuclease YncB( thermonuclease family)
MYHYVKTAHRRRTVRQAARRVLNLTLLVAGLWLPVACAAQAATLTGRVVTVFDGDSFILLSSEEQISIRLAEIDTPEVGQDWFENASRALETKILRKAVRVEVTDTDRFGRRVGKVWLGERDINREMIAEGHAWAFRQYLRDESLMEDEAAAREAAIGLWSLPDPIAPWRWRRQQEREGERPTASQTCRIKGNISSSGKRIYHVPGQRYYDRTRISTGKGERWFCSEAEAREAGWRRSRV